MLFRFLHHDGGATAIEYALVACLISLAVIVGATAVGTKLQTYYYQPIADKLR